MIKGHFWIERKPEDSACQCLIYTNPKGTVMLESSACKAIMRSQICLFVTVIILHLTAFHGVVLADQVEADELPISFEEDLGLGGFKENDVLIQSPTKVVLDSEGRIYIVDSGLKTIHRFEENGAFSGTIGMPGDGPGDLMPSPTIAFDSSDRLFVAGVGGRVDIIDRNGVYLNGFTRENPGGNAQAISVIPTGQVIIVAVDLLEQTVIDTYTSSFVYDKSFGETYAVGRDEDWRIETSNAGGFIDQGPNGNIFYVQKAPFELRKYTAEGELVAHTVEGASKFIPLPPQMEEINGKPFVPIRWGSTGVAVLSNGNVVCSGYRLDERKQSSIVCVFSKDLKLIGKKTLPGIHSVLGKDTHDRVFFFCNEEDSPVVVRRRISLSL